MIKINDFSLQREEDEDEDDIQIVLPYSTLRHNPLSLSLSLVLLPLETLKRNYKKHDIKYSDSVAE